MRVLLTGANGFIGRYLLARLQSAGHQVVPAVRNPAETDRLLISPASIRVDFNSDVTPDVWLPRLKNIDAVVNCAGVLQGGPGQSIAAIHSEAPKALFRACELAGIGRVIQISAVGTDAGTGYARTKRAADDYLASLPLDWVLLRPSLVYAPGAYGGTALFRALAALPFAIPVIGKGEQAFQPIHIDDLAQTVLHILATPAIRQCVIAPAGPDRLTLREILIDLRRWLGFAPVPVLSFPLWLAGLAAKVGDMFGGTINTTALRQLAHGNAVAPDAVVNATGIQPRHWNEALLADPAQMQDRWHARLYFVRPLLRACLAAAWIGSGIAGLLDRENLTGLFTAFGIVLSLPMIWTVCLLDIAVGLAVLARWRTQAMALVQLVIVVMYSVALTLAEPSLWLAPFGPLLKNLPFVAAVLALAALERER